MIVMILIVLKVMRQLVACAPKLAESLSREVITRWLQRWCQQMNVPWWWWWSSSSSCKSRSSYWVNLRFWYGLGSYFLIQFSHISNQIEKVSWKYSKFGNTWPTHIEDLPTCCSKTLELELWDFWNIFDDFMSLNECCIITLLFVHVHQIILNCEHFAIRKILKQTVERDDVVK